MTNKPPAGLSVEAKGLWAKLIEDFAIDDAAGFLLLRTALEAFDRMKAAQRELKRDGMTVKDRFGQPKPHPAAVIERDARSGMLGALRALKLDPSTMDSRK